MGNERVDLTVIGAGPGGYVLAYQAAKQGLKTVLVERDELGGTCLNRGCMPTKTYLAAAHTLHVIGEAAGFGVHVDAPQLDAAALVAHKDACVTRLRGQIAALMDACGVEVKKGTAKITAPGRVALVSPEDSSAGEPAWESERIVVAVGGVPAVPAALADAYRLPCVVTSDELLDEKFGGFFPGGKRPESVAVIGGGVIGTELATFFGGIGIPVTVFEYLPRILANFDPETAKTAERIFKKRSVKLRAGVTVESVEAEGEGALLRWRKRPKTEGGEPGKEESAHFDLVLLATGRRPIGEACFDASLAPKTEKGYLVCDENYETSVPGVYAIGDCRAGSRLLAHAAEAEAKDLLAFFLGKERVIRTDTVPGVVYCDPEIASCGLTEEEAAQRGIEAANVLLYTTANGKSLIENAERGFVKLVYEKQNGKLLGATLYCERAGDLISEISQALSLGLTMRELASSVRPHPSFSEMLTKATDAFLFE